ncbi:MAG: hypothetical protein A3G18_12935 [Rhodospirillales bacterium RIFCSPLOWO2_12_FULL_58_28]|nr:MAG: hypothetical protein A3H92_12790 [Rhodospirillales bacterium RIFCSPLOWO2_02_FULL_58_16]OHC78489.1 MAG: hypothetical protein A3G18_12935 [Rhodospirillales bacterium RIFCSPLOWO2_12_FULL_58_28]
MAEKKKPEEPKKEAPKKEDPKKEAPKKKESFWRSKAAKRAILVFGLPIIGILGWYAYTVTYELNKPTMKKFEEEMVSKAKSMAEKAIKEGFAVKDVDACQKMIDEYTTPKGWTYTDATLYELVGLPKTTSREKMEERCIFYAKTVVEMEKLSHHTRHVFVCGESRFEAGKSGHHYITADPGGRGAIEHVGAKETLVPIPVGKSKVHTLWQFYNVGDGCIIVGLSKSEAFSMSGHVTHAKEDMKEEPKKEAKEEPKKAPPSGH